MRRALVVIIALALPVLAIPGHAQKRVTPARTSADQTASDDVSIPRETIQAALKLLGVPYVPGGNSRAGLDCSGLVFAVFLDTTGMEVPRGVGALFQSGQPVTYPLHIGDLIFFDTESVGSPSIPCHVGIYEGKGKFIHAASEGSRTGVIVSELDSPYYRNRFLGARRVIPWRQPVLDVDLTDTPEKVISVSPFASHERMIIEVFNRMSGGGPMDLTVLKDGEQMLFTRIAPGACGPAVVPLVPDEGTWDVRVNRLWKGRELERVTFTVEE
jgi:hypothetical protein